MFANIQALSFSLQKNRALKGTELLVSLLRVVKILLKPLTIYTTTVVQFLLRLS